MFGMRNGGSFFPTDYCGNIDMKNMGKDFLSNALFLSEISYVSWRSADERLRGDVDAGFAQLPLYHFHGLLQIGYGYPLSFKSPIVFLKRC